MQGLLPLLSFAIWIGVWVLVVKKRGRLKLLTSNLLGALAGFIAATVVLAALAPDLPTEQKAANADSTGSAADAQKKDAEPVVAVKDVEPKTSTVGTDVVDAITLIYLKHKVYANGAVECVPAVIGGRDMIGCRSVGLDGRSNVHVWEYANGVFNSINGSANSLAETKFSSEGMIRVSPLPLASDIDVAKIVEVFNRG